ncbi:MAG: Lipoprotein-releasing system transmembrane protein LolE [Holosporales bacterium]
MFLSNFERKIAWRYLSASKKKGFVSFFAIFSFLGIALGVATLIIVTSVMNGFRQDLLQAIIGMRPHILISAPQLHDDDPLKNKISHVTGIKGIYPTIEKQNILTFQGQARGVMVQCIAPEDFKDRAPLMQSIEQGNTDLFKDDGIIIGCRLAQELNIKVHDRLALMSPEGNQTAFGNIPRQRSFEVVAIFNYGMREFDKGYVFIPLKTGQSFYKMQNNVHFFGIFTDHVTQAPSIALNLQKILGAPYHVIDWKHQDQGIFHAVEVEKNVMFLILTLLILIAGFNITSSLVMLVKDKTKSIGILKTLGATRANILRIFSSIGLFIGLVGTFLGIICGVLVVHYIENIRRFLESLLQTELFSAEIYYLTKLPAVLIWSDVGLACLISILLSVVASYFPARAAAKLDPVEALRH